MNYVFADKAKAVAAGFSLATHNVSNGKMVLTEKEVETTTTMEGSIEERLKEIDGTIIDGMTLMQK